MDQAIEVIKWFNNHSRALGLLKQRMLEKLFKVYVLILPVITRWTSHYLSCKRLLLVATAMRTLVLSPLSAITNGHQPPEAFKAL